MSEVTQKDTDLAKILRDPMEFGVIQDELSDYINRSGIETEHWFIGTAADVDDRLFNFHGLNTTDLYFARRAKTVAIASRGAKYLRASTSATGRFDEPEPDAAFVYAYPITATSIQEGPLPPSDGTQGVIVISLPKLSELAIHDFTFQAESDAEIAAYRDSYSTYLPQYLQWLSSPIKSAGLTVEFDTDESAIELAVYRGNPAHSRLARKTMERMSFRFGTCIDLLRKRGDLLEATVVESP